ncbi:hypothetical protein E2C01_099166 [Portunus trituberculatus]|uniref:Uncharacterized protein n=1 Tax=Portunus trituberculatus TaxID=210409 RepID=A0A5B7KG46_PORTR|nr:hypothetical protein [Portunus trituberculatus]
MVPLEVGMEEGGGGEELVGGRRVDCDPVMEFLVGEGEALKLTTQTTKLTADPKTVKENTKLQKYTQKKLECQCFKTKGDFSSMKHKMHNSLPVRSQRPPKPGGIWSVLTLPPSQHQ